MPHIDVPAGTFGILSLFAARPDVAGPLNALAETLLRGPSPLSRGERELIAAYVSGLNDCAFCSTSHAAFAARQLEGGAELLENVLAGDLSDARIGPKLRALLAVAAQVQRSGRAVTEGAVSEARARGATDADIHDTVAIAAAFCMFNRYVDGLATVMPDPAVFDGVAAQIVEHGYVAVGAGQGRPRPNLAAE